MAASILGSHLAPRDGRRLRPPADGGRPQRARGGSTAADASNSAPALLLQSVPLPRDHRHNLSAVGLGHRCALCEHYAKCRISRHWRRMTCAARTLTRSAACSRKRVHVGPHALPVLGGGGRCPRAVPRALRECEAGWHLCGQRVPIEERARQEDLGPVPGDAPLQQHLANRCPRTAPVPRAVPASRFPCGCSGPPISISWPARWPLLCALGRLLASPRPCVLPPRIFCLLAVGCRLS
jgi:hypothetical protein